MKTTDTYLQLLRAACLGTTYQGVVMPAELQELLRLCRIHGTEPLIYNELLKQDSLLEPAVARQMKQLCMHHMLRQTEWERIIARAWQALGNGREANGREVKAVLMKGFAYAKMYPLPYLRSWGDLDIWVGPEQYHRACGLLREAFPEAKHHEEEWEELKHYCFVFPNSMAIELHRVSMDFLRPKDQAYWCQLEAEAAQLTYAALLLTNEQLTCQAEGKQPNSPSDPLVISGVEIPLFEPKFDLLFCFMHSWEHFCGTGIPLKQVCDMVLLMRHVRSAIHDRSSVDAYLEKHLRALHMLEVWRYYGYMACRVMGLDMAEWPLLLSDDASLSDEVLSEDVVKHGERLLEQVLGEGQCRKKDFGEAADRYEAREHAKQMNILARKLLTLRQRLARARFLSQFAPRYARYVLAQDIKKGIRRTIHGAAMIDY